MGYQASEKFSAKYHAAACPTCEARPGQPCVTASGYITAPHKTRPVAEPRCSHGHVATECVVGYVEHLTRKAVTEAERWRIHNPEAYPHLYYVFTTENDANTALLALGRPWKHADEHPT